MTSARKFWGAPAEAALHELSWSPWVGGGIANLDRANGELSAHWIEYETISYEKVYVVHHLNLSSEGVQQPGPRGTQAEHMFPYP